MLKRKFFCWLTISNFLYIIVLLILAAVSIATLTGENGILTRANESKTETEIGEEEEAIKLAYNGVMADNLGDGVTAEQLENELQNAENKKAELQQTISNAKSQKSQCESDLAVQKNRYNKMKDKLERMNTAYSRVEGDLNAYVAATKKFESSSSDKTQKSANAVEKCMTSIEEYLNTSL